MGALRNLREEFPGVLAILILGAGLVAMLFPALSPVPFWAIWIIGFAVVLPLAGIMFDEDETEAAEADDPDPDPLEELKRRYAAGEIDEAEFERRVERLLETEDEDSAAEFLERRRGERDAGTAETERA